MENCVHMMNIWISKLRQHLLCNVLRSWHLRSCTINAVVTLIISVLTLLLLSVTCDCVLYLYTQLGLNMHIILHGMLS